MKPRLDIQRAMTAEDFEGMRLVRNACRLFMTNDTSEISPEQQERWRMTISPPQVFAYVVRIVNRPQVIGYGLLQRQEYGEPYWVTGAISEQYRGLGLGRELFQHLVGLAGRPCWLQVRADNKPARSLYERIGFTYQANAHRGAAEGVLTMVLA